MRKIYNLVLSVIISLGTYAQETGYIGADIFDRVLPEVLEIENESAAKSSTLKIGWASMDITPSKPLLLRGQFYARFSEGVLDPIDATALAIESIGEDGAIRMVMVTCDLVAIPNYIRNRVRELVRADLPELVPTDITISATHTHTAPMMADTESDTAYGLPFEWLSGGQDAMTPQEYYEFVSERIAEVVLQSWENRISGGISFGLSKAVVGHNRLHVNKEGKSTMYGKTDRPEFSHVEGYEDHNLNLLYTWNTSGKLTGVVINAAVTAQVSGHLYEISADFWNEAKALLRKELEEDLFILPQVSAAGDQSPWTTWDEREEIRMQELMGFGELGVGRRSMGRRKQIARHITDGVKAILPYMKANIEWNPVVDQRTEIVQLSRRSLGRVTETMLDGFREEMVLRKATFDEMLTDITTHPQKRVGNRWYKDITATFSHFNRARSVYNRYRQDGMESSKYSIEIKVIRIGDMAFATNPFELYLDYGIQIKTRSPAVQTFVVQLTGGGTYLPTKRSVDGGAYGAVPASTQVGPKGGEELVEKTLEMLHVLWFDD